MGSTVARGATSHPSGRAAPVVTSADVEDWQDPSTGKPKQLGDLWTLEKNGRKALCVLVGNPLGTEVRVLVDGDFMRSSVFREPKEMIDTMDEWRGLFEANGWVPNDGE